MTARTGGPFFLHLQQGYVCVLCCNTFDSYKRLARHQFEGANPCVKESMAPEEVRVPDSTAPFTREHAPVPASPPDPVAMGEHRDAAGRLRVAGTLIGHRRWAIGRAAGQFRLFPLFAKRDGRGPYIRGVTTAYCGAEEWESAHRSPDPSCECGLYAFWDPQAVAMYSNPGRPTILGSVQSWGKVLPGEKGFRAEYAMVDCLSFPTCAASDCAAPSAKLILRPQWIEWLTPGGRSYPRVNDRRHATYRDTADFTTANSSSTYLGWYCDEHAKAELSHPAYDCICNFPTGNGHHCLRPSVLTMTDLPYSWCHEHAPLVFDTADVMGELCNFYEVDALAPGDLGLEDHVSPDGPGNRPS